jgi:hypothetical protein
MNTETAPIRRHTQLGYSAQVPVRRGQGMIDQIRWCAAQFGPRWDPVDCRTGAWTVLWAGKSDPDHYDWCFAREQDLMLFLLKYSHDSN